MKTRYTIIEKIFMIIAIIILISLFAYKVFAVSNTGAINGNKFTNSSSTRAWINPINAKTNGNGWANVTLPPTEASSAYLQIQNFSFNIDSSATINGVIVEVEKRANRSNEIYDYSVFLMNSSGQNDGLDYANTSTSWSTTNTYFIYGDVNDLWGMTLTPSIVNNINFGVAFSAVGGGLHNAIASIDHVRMTIYYTLPSVDACLISSDGNCTAQCGLNFTNSGTINGTITINGTGTSFFNASITAKGLNNSQCKLILTKQLVITK